MAFKYNLPTIKAGTAFEKKLFYKSKDADGYTTPIDLTNFEARIQGRKKPGSPEVLFDWGDDEILLGVDGSIHIIVEGTKTKLYSFSEAEYDCLIWPTGHPELAQVLFQGSVKCEKSITEIL